MGTCPLAHGCGSDATSRQSRRDRRERNRKLVWHSCLLALLAELCVRRAARLGGNHAGSRIWHRKGGAGALGVFASVCGLWLSLCAASWYLVPRLLTAGARSVTDCNVDEHRRGEQWASECIDEALDSGLLARYWLLCPPAVLDIGIAHIPKLVTHIRCRDSIGRAAAARAPKEGLQ